MKRLTTLSKTALFILIFLGLSYTTNAATYTATASGNWSSSATWGGTAPGVNITGIDAIIIPIGVTVMLDEGVVINNALASVSVAGSLTGNTDLTLSSGTLTGAGTVNIGSLAVGTAGVITSTGGITVGSFSTSQTLLSLGSTINVNNTVTLNAGVLQLNSGGIINLANNAIINMAGGTFTVNGGAFLLGTNFNLVYSGSASSVGAEALLSGLQNVTINLSSSSNQINLSGSLAVPGALSIQQGTLNLNGYNLTINGTVSTTAYGSIMASVSSNISVNGTGNVGTIGFSGSGNTIGQLTLNIGSGGSVTLQSDLIVNGSLALSAGTLQVNSNQLTIAGTINGAGMIGTTTNSSIALTGSGNVGTLILSSGSVSNLNVNLSSGGSVFLGTDVRVNGALSISNGTLALNGYNLTTNGIIAVASTGSIAGNVGSDITINGSGAVGNLSLAAAANAISDLTVNITGGSVMLSSDITVGGMLSLQSGSLSLNGYSLAVNGTISSSGSGSIMGSTTSNVSISGSGSIGTIAFAPGGAMINNLSIDIAGNGVVLLAGDLSVGGALQLNNGSLTMGTGTLTINGTISTAGTGSISANSYSNININGSGSIGTLTFSSGSNTVGNLMVNISGGGNVALGSDLTVAGALSLTQGSLTLGGFNLAIAGTVTTSAGYGSIGGSGGSNISITGSGTIGTIGFASGSQTIGNLSINMSSSGSLMLITDLTVNGTLALTNGTIDIGNYNLNVAGGGIVQGGSSTSYVVTSGSGNLVMTVANAGATGTFQVGTNANFAPVVVTNNSTSSGNFMVNTHAGVFANGTSGADLSATQSAVNTSWNVESDITSGTNVNLEMFWNAGMEVHGFDRTQAHISHYVNGAWDASANIQATAHAGGSYSISRTGINSFSPFAVLDKNSFTSVADIKADAQLNLYPNPASNNINVAVANPDRYNNVRIYNAIGGEMLNYTISNTVTSIDISLFVPGVYILSLNNTYTSRFIKK